jgi:hypothetical protein
MVCGLSLYEEKPLDSSVFKLLCLQDGVRRTVKAQREALSLLLLLYPFMLVAMVTSEVLIMELLAVGNRMQMHWLCTWPRVILKSPAGQARTDSVQINRIFDLIQTSTRVIPVRYFPKGIRVFSLLLSSPFCRMVMSGSTTSDVLGP